MDLEEERGIDNGYGYLKFFNLGGGVEEQERSDTVQ